MPVTKEVAVIVGQSPNSTSQSEAMAVSKETASPALQALMEEQAPSEQILSEELVTTELAAVTTEPETAASQIADLVKKLKAKIITPGKTIQNVPNAVVKADANNVQGGQGDTSSSDQLRWFVVGGAALVLLLLLVILRRTSKPAITNSKNREQS
jgi:Flp pilus assembly protein TadG